ncbi:unnamed protein product [Meganyctiphanes norvegica]|uniref:XK-related protein n=1 Tax=Meganyctiphanes norvegica TaxID=48144 RepID=A0AAV2S162_MEGNR
MRASPALAGNPHPVVLSELPADPGGGRLQPLPNGTDSANQDGLEHPARFPAALLLFTHMVELATMLVATLIQAFPLSSHKTFFQEGHVVSSRIDNIALPMKISFGTLPLLLITIISFVWVLRAQDFSGRGAARFMCWLLHFLQASLIWRYLKVHLAYDSSDVVELGTLRFVQVHLHTLPFLVAHMYLTLNVVGSVGLLSISLATILVISAVIGVVVATTRARQTLPGESSLSPPTITQICHPPLHGNPESYELKKTHDMAAQVVVCITSVCVLWSRAMAVAMLFSLHVTWATVIIVLHWVAAIVWVTQQDVLETQTLNPARKGLRRAFLAYLLLWDWHVFRDDATAFTVCARPKFPAFYYTISACQNVVVTIVWFMTDKIVSPPMRTTALSSVIAAQIVALLLLTLSYLYISSLLPELPHTVKPNIITNLVKTPEKEFQTPPQSPLKRCPSYIDFKDMEDDTVVKQEAKLETPARNLTPIAFSTPKAPNTLPLAPHLLSRNLPPTMFTYSPDLLPQQHTKSEHSSTDYGSFNSRNTNTAPTQIPPDYDLIQRTHGSFSESFSSLSCGTVNKNGNVARIASKQKDATGSQHSSITPTQISSPTHTTCRSGFCHCKMFDVLESQCNENNEIIEKNISIRRSNLSKTKIVEIKTCNRSSNAIDVYCTAPRVAVVRGAQKFRVVCASCLHTHDPLLTMCHVKSSVNISQPMTISTISTLPISHSCHGLGGCSSTDYPSDTEVTATLDTLSSASFNSHSTYTTWPVGRSPGMARLLQLHPGSHDYVTAWLRHQQSRGPKLPSNHNDNLPNTCEISTSTNVSNVPMRRYQRNKRIHSKSNCLKTLPLSYLQQDLETIV